MSEPALPCCDHQEGCITCGDEAVAMRIVKIDRERDLALCELTDDSAKRESVEIALVHPVAEEDELLVHAGTAIAKTAPSRPRPRMSDPAPAESNGGGGA